tara:strand:- start:2494 stop:2751 length:258 start_codon:yes stop_codon:yes gene_type:complete
MIKEDIEFMDNTNHEKRTIPNSDSIVNSIIDQFTERAKFGLDKYGTDLDRNDLSVLDWIEHAKEEHMDAILYLEKLKSMLGSKKP